MLRDAYPFVTVFTVLGLICILLGSNYSTLFYIPAGLFILLALFVAYFFRNPERECPTDQNLVVSPADGRVVMVRPIDEAHPEQGTFVSIFLSVFDVHINRSPIAGRIVNIKYQQGKFLNALNHKSSTDNEQNIVTVENELMTVTFTQIAGVIARRIVFWNKVGDVLELGQRVGLIKFGSRTDLLLPSQVKVKVKQGDKVVGGLTIIGKVEQ